MDNLHTFGNKISIAADELHRPNYTDGTVKSTIKLVATAVKCTILGVVITVTSLLRSNLSSSKKDIQNHVALVTGGANGLGREICSELARCGCNVAIADVDIETARVFVKELMFLGVKAKAYEMHVDNNDEIVALKEKIKADLGDVDILVDNAGLLPKVSLLRDNFKPNVGSLLNETTKTPTHAWSDAWYH